MNWRNTSHTRQGYSIYQAEDPDRPGHTYVIQRKKDIGGLWRLAHRPADTEPLKIIYVGATLTECQDYAETYRSR